VFTVTANRTGVESRRGGRVRFTGRSQIVDPDGNVMVRATERGTMARAVDCDLVEARNKSLTRRTHLFRLRRPAYYRRLAGRL
ncbi:MAG TPA: hypothetical protein VGQ24_16435, partial [Gemmatimonadales bacterium]|jgi:predicted amidohydrolase|nr:hypothetical protein [Gemmatimonadales bacterium]